MAEKRPQAKEKKKTAKPEDVFKPLTEWMEKTAQERLGNNLSVRSIARDRRNAINS